jgi:molecular chaperone DnaJ
MVFSRSCASCGGSGHQVPQPCEPCGGAGLETRSETVTVTVPGGIAEGDRLRIPGKGHAGTRGGTPGDLYVTAKVAAHPLYRREGEDLHMIVPVAVHEAALGAKIAVRTLEGEARLRVPPGTQSGQRFRLRERGAPSTRTGLRGDLVVEVRIMLPKVLDERSKELLREFGRRNADGVRD